MPPTHITTRATHCNLTPTFLWQKLTDEVTYGNYGDSSKLQSLNTVPRYSYQPPVVLPDGDDEALRTPVVYLTSQVILNFSWEREEGANKPMTRGDLIDDSTVFVAGVQVVELPVDSASSLLGTVGLDWFPPNASLLVWTAELGLHVLVRLPLTRSTVLCHYVLPLFSTNLYCSILLCTNSSFRLMTAHHMVCSSVSCLTGVPSTL